MRTRAQATVEYVALLVALAIVLGAVATIAARRLGGEPAGVPPLARRLAPTFVLEHGADALLPVDPRRCRSAWCASGPRAQPVLFVHTVRAGRVTYVEYWAYLPASRTAHTGMPAFDGEHADDWEGVVVKVGADGRAIGARASAHLGWNGTRPWWELRRGDWAPYPAPVYRASGSHAGGFSPAAIDVAGDRWGGDWGRVRPRLLPAEVLHAAGLRYAPAAVPPWEKQVWRDPEAVTTGRSGEANRYADFARWWARACRPCDWWDGP